MLHKNSSLGRALPIAALILVAGCEESRLEPLMAYDDLSGVRLSEDLAPLQARALEMLLQPPAESATSRAMAKFSRLTTELRRSSSRRSAWDEAVSLWRAEPENFLWIDLVFENRWLVGPDARVDSILTEIRLKAPATPAAQYARAWAGLNESHRGEAFDPLEREAGTLGDLSRQRLNLLLTERDSNLRGPNPAIKRLEAELASVMDGGSCRLSSVYWRSLARHLRRGGRSNDALHAAVVSEALADHVGDPLFALRAASTRVLVLLGRGESNEAHALTLDCLERGRELDLPDVVGTMLVRQAESLEEGGEMALALPLRKQLVAVSIANRDSVNAPRDMWNVADDYLQGGATDSARVYVDRARDWIQRASDAENKAMFPFFDAQFQFYVGDFGAADSLLALTRAAGGTVWDEAQLLHDLLRSAIGLGRPAMAYRALRRLERLQPVLVDDRSDQNFLADLELDRAELSILQGELHEARSALERARPLVSRPGRADRSWHLHRLLGNLALAREDPRGALGEFRECLRLADGAERQTKSRLWLGRALLAAGQAHEARALFEPSEDSRVGTLAYRSRCEQVLMLTICDAELGRWEDAAAEHRQLSQLLTGSAPVDIRLRQAVEEGWCLEKLGQPRQGLDRLLDAKTLLEGTAVVAPTPSPLEFYREVRRDLVERLVTLLVDHPELATRELATETLGYRQLLMGHSPRARNLQRSNSGIGSPRITRISYLVGRERSFVWIGQGHTVEVEELPGRAELRRLVLPVLSDLRSPSHPMDASALDRLGDTLLRGLERNWQAGTRLEIVADDILRSVPWAALPFGAQSMLDHGPIVEAPREEYFAEESRPSNPASMSFLGLGWDAPGEGGGPRLARAESEVRRIGELWPGRPVRTVVGAGAESALADLATVISGFDAVHLAAHTTVSQGRAHHATLRFAVSTDPIVITAEEVRDWKLDSELIYLSACETAIGGGVSDLAGAFLESGARTVVASSFPVEDEAAADLALSFYRNWMSGKSKAASLRAALLELRESSTARAHPFYWASYRLIGGGS